MKSVDDHLTGILRTVQPLQAIDLQLMDSRGCLVADDLAAPLTLPGFDNAAMDGYAVCAGDLAGATPETPVTLPVVGDIAAGSQDVVTVRPGMCARIMTGAPMPPGADAVVPVEWTDAGLAKVGIRHTPEVGRHIRRAGEDVAEGDVVLYRGEPLTPARVGLVAAMGMDRIRVRPRPRVVVISTGSELVEPGQRIAPSHIVDSNSYQLTACALDLGCVAYRVGIVPDEPRTLLATLEDQLIRADAVVTSGGVSKGAYDVVKEVLSRLGTVSFDEVAMQPGKPQGFGTIGPDDTPIFALPGNPVSAFVSFQVFVRPALTQMMGIGARHMRSIRATLDGGVTSARGKRQFARGVLSRRGSISYAVSPAGGHGSHLLGGLARANCFIVLPEDVVDVPAGGSVECLIFDENGLDEQ
ncbi:MAG: molybdopterin molybdenumtransferase MoeA [Streptosporangiales bacterium]|nr:molybdopterin molybdenumtransferase MoeA [Streptosporangiales bacterium]